MLLHPSVRPSIIPPFGSSCLSFFFVFLQCYSSQLLTCDHYVFLDLIWLAGRCENLKSITSDEPKLQKDGDPAGQRPRRSNTPWPASTLQPVCSPATISTEICPPLRSRWSLTSAVRTTLSDTNRDKSPSGSPWQHLLVYQEPKDYGSTLPSAHLLLTSPPPNQPTLPIGVSSRRKRAHLIGSLTERKLINHFPWFSPLGCSGFDPCGSKWTRTDKVDEFQEKTLKYDCSRRQSTSNPVGPVQNLDYKYEIRGIKSSQKKSYLEKVGFL